MSTTQNKNKYALIAAVKDNNINEVEKLLTAGIEPDIIDENLDTALQLSLDKDPEIVKLLLEHGANPHVPHTHEQGSLLMVAAKKNAVAIVELLLKHGANPDPKPTTTNGDRVIEYAIKTEKDAQIVKAILEHGVDPNMDNRTENSLLGMAVVKSASVVKILLEHGADANARFHTPSFLFFRSDNPNFTPLLKALDFVKGKKETANDVDIIKLLLSHGADANKAWDSMTPLIMAIKNKKSSAAYFLLQHGVDPNVKDKNGQTALIHAAKQGYASGVDVLLYFKADPSLRDNYGKNAGDYARESGNKNIADVLSRKEENVNGNIPNSRFANLASFYKSLMEPKNASTNQQVEVQYKKR